MLRMKLDLEGCFNIIKIIFPGDQAVVSFLKTFERFDLDCGVGIGMFC